MPCILSSAHRSSPPVQFTIAQEWQHMVLTEKAGLCKNLPIAEMRKITMESGIASLSSFGGKPSLGIAMNSQNSGYLGLN